VDVGAHFCKVELPGEGWLMIDPRKDASLSRPDRRSLVIVVDRERRYYVSDGRRFVDRAGRRTGLQPISSATVLDDLTVGILWATTNTDVALLADDSQLASSQARLAHHEGRRTSDVPLSEVPGLNAVAGQWLGSRFCARHITRNLDRLSGEPFFWTREKRGEEAPSPRLTRPSHRPSSRIQASSSSTCCCQASTVIGGSTGGTSDRRFRASSRRCAGTSGVRRPDRNPLHGRRG
jgi:hypothetical protein